MKKFKKIVLASALALSTLAVLPVSDTEQASAAGVDYGAICKADSKCLGVSNLGVRKNGMYSGGYTRFEIKSGAGVVGIIPSGPFTGYLTGIKAGDAVVYAYDNSDTYLIFNVYVK
ncbi:hypothetical protein [Lysinibacillus xylanilyticus]|uniref:hypothetical protein n=1 Tax=Lysinibacillus xylanilyticus TaxID=582475 RepID=UPI003D083C6F